ncbi:hypothetical protein MKX01_006645 [Papaver californicum]|nr:hypothetical protein MKX01_006645 [Papaver californicum]
MPGRGKKRARNASNTRGSGNGEATNVVEMMRLMTKAMKNHTTTNTALIQNQNGNHNVTPPLGGNANGDNQQGVGAQTEWLNLLEKFIRLKPPTQQLDVFQLSGEARKWWENEYFPATVITKKIEEFVDVGQIRKELVDDYLDRYISLSRFTMFMIPDEEKSAKKFEQGLGDYIRNKVISHCFPTLQQVVERRAIEAGWLMHKKTIEERHKETNNIKQGNTYQHHGDTNNSNSWKKQKTDNSNRCKTVSFPLL